MKQETALADRLAAAEPACWINDRLSPISQAAKALPLTAGDVADASKRLELFAPVLMRLFPELVPAGGRIESPLTPIPAMQRALCEERDIPGRLLLKRDGDLPVSGSVKARGGIYEVLKHAETLALAAGILKNPEADHAALLSADAQACFGRHTIQVGSTGNLGLSIGLMGSALGFRVVVHMSADARAWKKELLRSRGVTVIEYAADYSLAVREGRALSDADPMSYFIDDETSRDLFLGYAVAAERLAAQLDATKIPVDASHPLFVFLPCGVGGAPGGITFGLKLVFGDYAHAFIAEPVQAPCMLLGLSSGRDAAVSVSDIGLTGKTQADGLAVGRASQLVCDMMHPLLDGAYTDTDAQFISDMRLLHRTEGLYVEPSAAAGFSGVRRLLSEPAMRAYLVRENLDKHMKNATLIVWATGGALVPAAERRQML